MAGDSNNETNFSHKLLLTNTQFSMLRKGFANGLSANVKISKIQLSNIIKLGRYLGPIVPDLPLVLNPEKMAIELFKNIKEFPKSKKDVQGNILNAGLNIAGKKRNLKLLLITG